MNPNIAAAAAACSSSSRECACVDRTEVAFCDSSRAVGKSPNQGFGEGGPGAGGGESPSLLSPHPIPCLRLLLTSSSPPPQLSRSVCSGPCSPAPHTLDGRRGVGAGLDRRQGGPDRFQAARRRGWPGRAPAGRACACVRPGFSVRGRRSCLLRAFWSFGAFSA